MTRKSGAVAAVLNFLFPGVGFAYLGRPWLIVGGLVFFGASTVDAVQHLESALTSTRLLMGLVAAGGMAVLGGDVAEMFNRVGTGYRTCPFCAEQIRSEAKVCKHCGRDLPQLTT